MAVKTCVLTTEPPRKSPASHLALPLSESMFVLSQGHLLCACVRASLAAAAKLLLSCPTLCDPKDGSPPGSPVPGSLRARTLEWVASSFSSAWKWKVKVKLLSCVRLLTTPWTAAYQAPLSMGFSRQEYWSGVPLPSPRASLSQEQFQQRGLWVGWHHLLWSGVLSLWPSKRLSVSCVVGKVFWTFRVRNMWAFISYLGRAQPCLLLLLLRNFCPQGTKSSCSSWGPSTFCLKFLPERCEPTGSHYWEEEGWRSV